ncbi:MAG: hypothetical protein ACPGJF_18370 [Sinimarinibacterium flocculans]|uniref:hypothetical protein n=1 Tax=Sinimarinibacterium flocculans TaxID=985250 RepID=UPI003C50FAAC
MNDIAFWRKQPTLDVATAAYLLAQERLPAELSHSVNIESYPPKVAAVLRLIQQRTGAVARVNTMVPRGQRPPTTISQAQFRELERELGVDLARNPADSLPDAGYIPLTLKLAGYWDLEREDLPEATRLIVDEYYWAPGWEALSPEQRRIGAQQHDYQHDPKYEPAAYWGLTVLADELAGWIDEAKKKSEYAAAVKLSEVAARIEQILAEDRSRVGAEIQALRSRLSAAPPSQKSAAGSDGERDKLLRQIGALAMVLAEKGAAYRRGSKPNASRIAEAALECVEALPDARLRGLKDSAFRDSISAGIRLLEGEDLPPGN